MKPAWDKLIKEFEGSSTALVADVDCTAAGKDLCETHGVQGYPTIKWGDPSDLQDYEGGRDAKELKKFAKENLKPICSPKNIDLCDEEKKTQISTLMSMGAKELKAKIDEAVQKQTDVVENFNAEVDKMERRYEQLEKEKTETLENKETVQKETDVEENFNAEVDKLQKRYMQMEKEKTETLKEIKESGLGLMKAVLAQRKDKEEL